MPKCCPRSPGSKASNSRPTIHPEGDVWIHTLLLLEQLHSPRLELALAALLHDIGKPVTFTVTDRIRFNRHDQVGAAMARDILSRLRFPGEIVENTVSLIAQHMRFTDAEKMRESTFKRFTRQPVFPMLIELYRMDKLAGNRNLEKYEQVERRWRAIPAAELHPPPLLDGHDLIRAGVPQGPAIGRFLAELEDEQLEGRRKDSRPSRSLAQASLGESSHLSVPRGRGPMVSQSTLNSAPFLKSISNVGAPSRNAASWLNNGSCPASST